MYYTKTIRNNSTSIIMCVISILEDVRVVYNKKIYIQKGESSSMERHRGYITDYLQRLMGRLDIGTRNIC